MLIRMVLVCLIGFQSGLGLGVEDLWSKGIQAYDDGEFQEAASSFEALLQTDSRRPHVLYNLGNTYFKMGKKGAALGAYYGARELLPRDPDLKANISFIEKSVPDQLDSTLARPLWTRGFFWLESWSEREQFLALSLCFFLAFSFVGLAMWVPNLKVSAYAGAFTLALVGSVFVTGMVVYDVYTPHWGAVGSASTAVVAGPSGSATPLFNLQEGAPVMVLENQGDWLHVGLSDGKKGWTKSASVTYFNIERGIL